MKFRRKDGNIETVEKKETILSKLKNGIVEKKLTTTRTITTQYGKLVSGSIKHKIYKEKE